MMQSEKALAQVADAEPDALAAHMVWQDRESRLLRTAKFDEPLPRVFRLCAKGTGGETGEIEDLAKKIFFHHYPFNAERRAKMIEEGGDVMFYVVYLLRSVGLSITDLFSSKEFLNAALIFLRTEYHPERPLDEQEEIFSEVTTLLSAAASKLGEYLIPRSFRLNSFPLNAGDRPVISEMLVPLCTWLSTLAVLLNSDLAEMMEVVIAKLEKRYPNGFTVEDSMARRDQAPAPGSVNLFFDELPKKFSHIRADSPLGKARELIGGWLLKLLEHNPPLTVVYQDQIDRAAIKILGTDQENARLKMELESEIGLSQRLREEFAVRLSSAQAFYAGQICPLCKAGVPFSAEEPHFHTPDPKRRKHKLVRGCEARAIWETKPQENTKQ
jgi:NTP pyrophosphatase (non-canonical NTP hydrolase)